MTDLLIHNYSKHTEPLRLIHMISPPPSSFLSVNKMRKEMENRYVLVPNYLLFFFYLVLAPLLCSSQLSPEQNTTMTMLSKLQYPSQWNTTNTDPCTWKGVNCSTNSPSQVIHLSLAGLGLTDTVAASNGGLFNLLCRLASLQSLDLSQNFLNSIQIISSSVCPGLVGLKSLNLSINKLSGTLPTFSNFAALESLDLSMNRFNGSIDSQLKGLVKLRSLNLSSNAFTGPVPTAIGSTGALQELQLSHNDFKGPIPPSLLAYKNLSLLDLSWNQISGSVLPTIAELSKLRTLVLSGNNLTGPIPPTLSAMSSLTWFGASKNSFSGTIPLGITRNLQNLDLSFNDLGGSIPPDLLSCQKLASVDLSCNSLTGPIPGNLSLSLYRLRLSSNSLNGSIPPAIGGLSGLTYLELDNNSLEGEIPSQLWNCKNLTLLNLAANRFHGALPRELSNLRKLVVLKLQMNNISGEIPDQVSQLGTLITLNISHNSLTGKIPPSISNLQKLTTLNLENNQLNGSIPANIINLIYLMELRLGNNKLVMPIPKMPSSLATSLNLSSNEFQGPIPTYFSELQQLEVLDLSNNQFTGEVPYSFLRMNSLTNLVLSNNQLSGTVPPFLSWVIVDTTGNKNLKNNTPTPSAYLFRQRRRIPIFMVVIVCIIGAIIGIGLAAAILLFVASRRFNSVKDENLQAEDLPQIVISRLVTENRAHKSGIDFSKAMEAVCTSGKIFQKTRFSTYYKAVMPGGMSYSVKKLNWTDKIFQTGNHVKFGKEIEVLGKLNNSNIMVPLAYALTVDCAYLFYEHQYKGTVWDFLHKGTGDILDWPSRYSIALGVAQGMAFLHGCNQPVLLLDLSTKSILLKSAKEPQIGDIELLKVIDPSKSAGSLSAVVGSVGYVPPEYAYTMRVTMAGNVYSFGVVLLELLTGRLPVSQGIELAKQASSYSNRMNGREQILDSRIYKTSVAVRSQMKSVLKIALDCVSYSPEARPKMRTVVGSLLHAR